MSVWDNMQKMADAQKHPDQSKEKLKESLTKFLQTTMIGALDRFEKRFGELWGKDKDEDKLSEKEVEWDEAWMEVRDSILTNGNNQIRSMLKKIDEYKVEYRGKKTNFYVRGNQ